MTDNNMKRVAIPKIAEDVVIQSPRVFGDPDFTNGAPALGEEEVTFFKKNGFVVKRGLLDEKENFARIVDYIWEHVPRELLRRDDPKTWLGAPHGQWTEADAEKLGLFSGGSWKMRSRGGIGTEPFLVDLIANHPHMQKLVALFIGEPVKRVKRVRGVYGIFPKPPGTQGQLGPHADHTAAQLSAMVFVDAVSPHCGGFTVWPGSHRIVHPHFSTVYGPVGVECAEAYARARDRALKDIAPVEFTGQAGDVLFWHPKLLHSAGINHSADHARPVLRLIVPCDYQRADRTFFDDLVEGPGPNHQWWVDTRNFCEDVPATPDNIWDGWAFG